MKYVVVAILTAIFGAMLSVEIGLETGLILTKEQALGQVEREKVRAEVVAELKKAQENYFGPVKENGCYTFEHRNIQSAIDNLHFTAAELGQSTDELLCHGWIMPEDLFK